jgi:hypothetical protein
MSELASARARAEIDEPTLDRLRRLEHDMSLLRGSLDEASVRMRDRFEDGLCTLWVNLHRTSARLARFTSLLAVVREQNSLLVERSRALLDFHYGQHYARQVASAPVQRSW